MKILFTGGGGSGGHFYPIIAVARALRHIAQKEHIIDIHFFFAGSAFDERILAEENIEFIKISAGKFPRYFSLQYFITPFSIVIGIFSAFWKLYALLPDIIFSKGGYSAFPILVAARLLKIPVIVHESDSVPGMVNRWSGKWAQEVIVSFPKTVEFFKKNPQVRVLGNPIRSQVVGGNATEAFETFSLEEQIPIILVLGGSQGAEIINEAILGLLSDAVSTYQIIHQTGRNNFEEVKGRASVILGKNDYKHRYHAYPFLGEGDLRNASKVASLVVSRAGSGGIFEIAAWGIPTILIPITGAAQNHQRENAYAYARSGACEIIEETNVKPHLLLAAINKIVNDPQKIQTMKQRAQEFAKLDAAERIGYELIALGVHD